MDALSLVLGIVAGVAGGTFAAIYLVNKKNESKASSSVNEANQKATSIIRDANQKADGLVKATIF